MPILVLKEATRRAMSDSVSYQGWFLDQVAQHGQYRVTNNAQQVKNRIAREAGRFDETGTTWALEDISQADWPIDTMTALITELNAVLDKGVEALEYPAFVLMNKTQYEQDDVPNYINNNDLLDDEGNPIRNLKWSEWKAPNYTHRRNEADTEYYVPLNSNNNGYYHSGVAITRLESEPYVVSEMSNYPPGIEV